ncbi:NERD domain-containing protein [Aquibacillus sp. 3ASR75-11]|uniref:NERD domain-containing protein n=1 Tax=Terrihalobacillus insolitus TaxID=2950438 RepID=A0A9X4AMV5_9BACI|nr:nuclease-related domain-containing protein [Terrihalobacillus insolitus]MDC3415121.1 NERD domain-containing protein [Terrihalobacillus insolitus]MDC3425842.1 NERD domain-containing protein [Terrihalobacillus insolitus]
MPYKSRTKSLELLVLESLDTRMHLSDKDKQYYHNLRKGYEGEKVFDALLEKQQFDCLILNDLLLKLKNTTFQIDSLVIMSGTIQFYEVKNFEGDFIYESDKLYKNEKIEVSNPLNQLNRSESLLRQLIQSLGFNFSVKGSVVFINPEFTLYQSPLNRPFIFPTQINSYLNKLSSSSSKLHGKHKALADKLIALHMQQSPYQLLPSYDYDQLTKGITCLSCNTFNLTLDGRYCVCKDCGHKEMVDTALLRSVKEYKLLFSNKPITTNGIHEWCKIIESKRTIRRVLEQNFKKVGIKQWAQYE